MRELLIAATLVIAIVMSACTTVDKTQGSNSLAQAADIIEVNRKLATDLPALPAGWTVNITPIQPEVDRISFTDSNGVTADGALTTKKTHISACTAAFNTHDAPMEVADSIQKLPFIYEFELISPPKTSRETFDEVLRVEYQRAFGFRLKTEKRMASFLYISAPNGLPAGFHRSVNTDNLRREVRETIMAKPTEDISSVYSYSEKDDKAIFTSITMADFISHVARKRNMFSMVFDETGIKGEYDVEVPKNYAENDELRKLGFKLREEQREVEFGIAVPAPNI